MVRHVVLFRWKPDTTAQQLEALERGLREMPRLCPTIRRYRFGRNLALQPGGFDFAIVADFDDADGWRAYWANDAHQKQITDHVRPIALERAAVQYELEPE